LVGAEIFGASGGHVVGRDVVQSFFRADAEACSDGTRLVRQSDSMSDVLYFREVADKTRPPATSL